MQTIAFRIMIDSIYQQPEWINGGSIDSFISKTEGGKQLIYDYWLKASKDVNHQAFSTFSDNRSRWGDVLKVIIHTPLSRIAAGKQINNTTLGLLLENSKNNKLIIPPWEFKLDFSDGHRTHTINSTTSDSEVKCRAGEYIDIIRNNNLIFYTDESIDQNRDGAVMIDLHWNMKEAFKITYHVAAYTQS